MSAERPIGIDANGYVVTVGAVPLQPEFEPLLADVLSRYRTEIAQAENTSQRLCLQGEAASKLIRSTHTLRSADATMWPQTLEEHVALFRQRYPTMITQIAYFLFEARNPSAEREAFLLRLDAFIGWMTSQPQ